MSEQATVEMDPEDVSNSNLCAVGSMYSDDFFSRGEVGNCELGRKEISGIGFCT